MKKIVFIIGAACTMLSSNCQERIELQDDLTPATQEGPSLNKEITNLLDRTAQSCANITAEWLEWSEDTIDYMLKNNQSVKNTLKNQEQIEHAITRHTNDSELAARNLKERGITISASTTTNGSLKQTAENALKGVERELKKAEALTKDSPWENIKTRYQELLQDKVLQSYRNNKNVIIQSTFSYATIMRIIGYAVVFTAGPYVGNKLYEKLLAHFFTPAQPSKNELVAHITKLEESCLLFEEKINTQQEKIVTIASSAEKQKLTFLIQELQEKLSEAKQEIELLEQEMMHPTKPGQLLNYAGMAVRIGTMAATTYALYAGFSALDRHYLSGASSPEELTTLAARAKEFEHLTMLKVAHEQINNLQKIKKDVQLAAKDINNLDHSAKETIELLAYKENSEQNRDDALENKEEQEEQLGSLSANTLLQFDRWLKNQ